MQVERHEGVPIVTLGGEVDHTRAATTRDSLLRAVTNQEFGLVVDLRSVTYLDSAGVHVLFEVAERLEARQQKLVAVIPSRAIVKRVLEIVNLRSVAATHDTLESAVAAVRALAPATDS